MVSKFRELRVSTILLFAVMLAFTGCAGYEVRQTNPGGMQHNYHTNPGNCPAGCGGGG